MQKNCPDVITNLCPCINALTSNCPICSLLRGEDKCTCNWQGECIYYKFIWQDKRIPLPQNVKDNYIIKKDVTNSFFISLFCIVPETVFEGLQLYQVCQLSSELPYYSTQGIVVNKLQHEQIVIFAINDHNLQLPLVGSPIFNHSNKINIKKGELVLKLPNVYGTDILITIDGFWNSITNSVINDLLVRKCKVTCIGNINIKNNELVTNNHLRFVPVGSWKEVVNYVTHHQNKYKLVLLLNTSFWQRKLIDSFQHLQGINIFTVGNDLL